MGVAPGFKNKTRYTPHVSLKSQISHIATNKGNINRQCSIYNVLSIKSITFVGTKSDQLVNICSFDVRCDRRWPSTQ